VLLRVYRSWSFSDSIPNCFDEIQLHVVSGCLKRQIYAPAPAGCS
jgi:hypothetical protein